ncbi:hypothetical protein SERLA73DRAFT_180203 [Serpula lacrymans var. lacrymans S7.3]|uniref:Acireductone dioxygenase n=2 Tax=Serpula lacrymans var. lacrymans TaxID=341189 RepID=F8PWA1_SERL3|nr:uncharacterized protein SERLADRAFT_465701 [Serpula lacrymans var. lacrymans S7.9]EGN99906.1 hypothetical protein SERLA73DRAFT_180203 [Serpula lacrymans var. lacrymans S7.3]EGO25473.1 hypothetical protein SERLADRAFT_465701 [Serpula lacrymans var. lacrymans S7.9]
MRAYYFDNLPGDQRLPHDSGNSVSDETLKSIGVLHWHIPIDEEGLYERKVDEVAQERNYKNRDVIAISKESLGDQLEVKLKTFYHEHMHEDEEIRYIMKGSGFFDVREHDTESWIRCHMGAGDLMVLPAGIYHRFTLDENNAVRTMRLFKDEPKWIAYNRGPETDANQYRVDYVNSLQTVAVN